MDPTTDQGAYGRTTMLTGPRFAFYRWTLAGAPSRGFRDYPIEPVAQPVDTEIKHVAHDDLWPDLPLPADVLAKLVVRGPFGPYLRGPTPEEVAAGEVAQDEYVVDLSHYLDLPAKPGLLRPGGKAVFTASVSGLRTAR